MTNTSPAAMEALVRQLRGEGDAHLRGNVRDHRTMGCILLAAADALEAQARAAPEAAPVQGRVKALVWDEGCAETSIGDYFVLPSCLGGFHLATDVRYAVRRSRYPTEEAAKAAAQADYEARILSALEPAPMQGWQQLQEAAKVIIQYFDLDHEPEPRTARMMELAASTALLKDGPYDMLDSFIRSLAMHPAPQEDA
ncbi:hypothetical protein [Falsirhodobacter sp. 20TX0035]|uniref:hypothetical protein n=1 Tax=Falsirhodobacter sp. 20TX0035 TaxID=3022019 RepID=UPI00232AFC26|nr:hypothetical protein [Falsirhodobacter sp. 20TX0035]MDB6454720.1 hypothetical protein [Falsirhodobacter sp. 20TX0035]